MTTAETRTIHCFGAGPMLTGKLKNVMYAAIRGSGGKKQMSLSVEQYLFDCDLRNSDF